MLLSIRPISTGIPFSFWKHFFGAVRCGTVSLSIENNIKQCNKTTSSNRTFKTSVNKLALRRNGCNEKESCETHYTDLINQISKILQCSAEEIDKSINKYENSITKDIYINEIEGCFQILQNHGIEKCTVMQNIWTLFTSTHQLNSRLELLEKWRFGNLNNAVGFIKIPMPKLQKYTYQTEEDFEFLGGENKITYFSSFIKCDEKEACELFLKYQFLMTVNLQHLKDILKMARDVDLLTEDILSDPWLFRYKPQSIAKRIEYLDAIGAKDKCDVLKPWMLRCPQSTVNRYFELKDENIAALGSYCDLKDFLTNELDLSEMEVEEMFIKHPPLSKIRVSKAKEMIDFLKSEGFRPKMIHQVPRVLCHKQDTLLTRILELKKINPKMLSLQNLCRNKKDYFAFLKRVQGPHS